MTSKMRFPVRFECPRYTSIFYMVAYIDAHLRWYLQTLFVKIMLPLFNTTSAQCKKGFDWKLKCIIGNLKSEYASNLVICVWLIRKLLLRQLFYYCGGKVRQVFTRIHITVDVVLFNLTAGIMLPIDWRPVFSPTAPQRKCSLSFLCFHRNHLVVKHE